MANVEKINALMASYESNLVVLRKLFMTDGVLDTEEQEKIDQVEALLAKVKLQMNEPSSNTATLLNVEPWRPILEMAVLAPEIKKILTIILEKATASETCTNEKAADLIANVSKYYDINIREGQEDARILAASKAALVVSLNQKKENWIPSDAHNLFESYYYKGVEFEEVTLSNPISITTVGKIDLEELALDSPAPILIPLGNKNLKKDSNGPDSLSFDAGIKLTFKKSVIAEQRIKLEDESKKWALESGSSLFSTMISATGKQSISSLDADIIKGIWQPFNISIRFSGPKASIDKMDLDVTLLTVSLSGELNGSEALKMLGGSVPEGIAAVSISFRLAFSVNKNLGTNEGKVLNKIEDVLNQKNEIISNQASDLYEKSELEKKLHATKSKGFLTDQDNAFIKESENKIKRFSDKIDNASKLLKKTDEAVAKLGNKLKSEGGKVAVKILGKNAAKIGAKLIGRFIPGVNVALLIWDGIELGVFIYNWYNSPSKEEIMLDAIKKMSPRMQKFMHAIIKKYHTIPDMGDDVDVMEDFLEGLDEDAFHRLLQRLETVNIKFKQAKGGGGATDKFIKKLQHWSEPDYELSETEVLDHLLHGIPSDEFKLKSSYVKVGMEAKIGDTLSAVIFVDVFDKEKNYQTTIELKDKIIYQVAERKGNCLKLVQISSGEFELNGHKLYINQESRYWSIPDTSWTTQEYFETQD